ncbi:hypothetical protein DRO32_04260 [Candidatus Bathyarchaeota archaeon]|nr:MAG: hypothetical protein DRO32_04260 [Candidatus Bathyarchaeota archaeon]
MKRPSLVFASVASELHVGRAREISRRAFATLNSLEAEVSGSPEPIEEPGELEEALSVDADLKVVFVASGGTSRLLSEALAGLHVFLWAHPEDNSLPSALSAREKMRSSGSWRGELVFSSPDEVPEKLSAELRAVNALRELEEAEIIAFCSASRAREIEEALGSILGDGRPRVRRMGTEVLLRAVQEARRPTTVGEATSMLSGLAFEEHGRELEEGLVKGLRIASFVEEMASGGRRTVVTFDCFGLLEDLGLTPCVAVGYLLDHGITAVCEADPSCLILMPLCHALSGQPPWMANLARFSLEDRTLVLAHCTACPSLAPSWPYRGHLMRHFESGRPLALDVWLRRGPVVLASLQVGRKKLVLARGTVRDSGLGEEGLCRTQALVELEGDVEAFLAETGNHHVLTYSDIYDELARAGRRLGLEVAAF